MIEKRRSIERTILYVIVISILMSPAMGFGATIEVHPGQKIQDAVNSASDGDTIIVYAGTYTENIEVKKQLTIQAQTSGQVTVTAKHGGTPCIIIKKNGNGSTIQGLILSGATSDDGIHLDNADNCHISNNNIWTNGHFGIHSTGSGNTISANYISNNGKDGIYSEKSSDTTPTTISGNTIEGNGKYGIHCKQDYNTINGNIIRDNGDHGIYSEGSHNDIYGNILQNTQTIGKDGIHIKGDYNTLRDNTIDNIQENGIYVNGKHNKIFGTSKYAQSISNCAEGIRLTTGNSPQASEDYNEVYNNSLKDNTEGIHVLLSSMNKIHDNRIRDHHQGIHLRDSVSNQIYGNTIKRNKTFGINIEQHVNCSLMPFQWNNVYNNTVSECILSGISTMNMKFLKDTDLNSIYENNISLCATGIECGRNNTNFIQKNTLTGVGIGIALELSKDITISQNNISADFVGILFYDSSSDDVSFNRIKSIADALVNSGSSPGDISAENNWWGSNDDPGSKIKGTVDYKPWLVLKVDANPEKIYYTGPLNTSTITADLCHDSSGNYHDPAYAHVPDGIGVKFKNENIPSLGTLNPHETQTTNGRATSTFTASKAGDADITATVDKQKVDTSVTIEALSFLSITKAESSDPVIAGRDIIYTIKVHSKGPDKAENVQLTDVIPPHLNNVRYSLSSDSGPWKNWPPASGYVDLGNLPVDHLKSVWIIGSVDLATSSGTVLTNTSSVTSTSFPGHIFTAQVSTTVRTVAELDLNKAVDKTKPNVGDRITFTVTAGNNGPGEAQDVVIKDVMPSEFANVAITPSKGSYNNGVWTIPSLTVGEQATLTLQGTVTQEMECKTYTNKATTKHPNAPKRVVNASISVVCPAPTIESFSPTSGGPGTTVVIIGTNFTGTEVKFGGTDAASFTVDSTTQITAVVGSGSTGKVTVTTDSGTATSAEEFTYAPIPTLSEWGMLLLGLLLLSSTVFVLRKRREIGR